jgi:hypothetical protein
MKNERVNKKSEVLILFTGPGLFLFGVSLLYVFDVAILGGWIDEFLKTQPLILHFLHFSVPFFTPI